ncbi:hypothetical protein D5E87_26210 [Vibrio parahaemolyticus]|uniref:hypothetical protein n=1 Tax=Vibrio TaxID=662 RepID=UPI0007A00D2B|nr:MULTISPECIES: hypothetical protein [Vibrio]EGQ8527990.1 hypothetical protein [Vibrio parahaemolyticus]EGQ9167585.1 hypothetical protein [Vibrio parahaemolyticus]EGQ9212008.1 hypothetical protein [Vibrio parahaemolyticus]EGQ9789810.1 hypothetical protein [Vibrio parahaemolyticus]EGQ9926486.1 hypothetical protein [Vibrio parahaemolyticus]
MIKVTFSAVNSGNHGAPADLLEKTYSDATSLTHLPSEGEEIIIQWGEVLEQSSTFVVEKVSKSFWNDSDHVQIWVKDIE